MKNKTLLLLLFMTISLMHSYGQRSHARQHVVSKQHHSQMPTPHQDFIPTAPHAGRIVVLQENFDGSTDPLPAGIPSTWITNQVLDNTGITMTSAFKIFDATTANSGGYWPVPSTTPGNRFAGANDDPEPCDCDLMNAWLETPILDFTGLSNMALYFDFFHDQNFGAGAARIAMSTDGGLTFSVIPIYPNDTITDLNVDESYWQNAVIPLNVFDNMSNLQLRFQWSDNGEWASGYAVDNVVIQEMDALDLLTNKVVFGNWDNATISNGLLDYKQIPLNQVSPIQATAVISNGGFESQNNVSVLFSVNQGGSSFGPYTVSSTDTILSFGKDTLTLNTDFTPSNLGVIQLSGLVTNGTDEINMINNTNSNSLEITTHEYARDNDICQLFYGNSTVYEFGNLFDIYQDDALGAIEVALRYGTSGEGSPITAKLYEFQGVDADGLPILVDTEQNTIEYAVTAADDNIAGQNSFITLPFADGPAQVQAGKTYLAAVTSTDLTDIAVSGFNTWPGSWFHDGTSWGWTYGIPMVRINTDESLSISAMNAPKQAALSAYPNPTVNQTTVKIQIPLTTPASWSIRDGQGRLIQSSMTQNYRSGAHSIIIDTQHWASGIYHFSFQTNENVMTLKLIK